MEPKGYVICNQEFIHTTLWPDPQPTLSGPVDLEKHYKEVLAGKLCPVVDISRDGDTYLMYGESSTIGNFIWQIEKADTVPGSFQPVKKKFGIVMPVGLTPIEEFQWIAEIVYRRKYD